MHLNPPSREAVFSFEVKTIPSATLPASGRPAGAHRCNYGPAHDPNGVGEAGPLGRGIAGMSLSTGFGLTQRFSEDGYILVVPAVGIGSRRTDRAAERSADRGHDGRSRERIHAQWLGIPPAT